MAEYIVRKPFAGYFEITVDAENEEQAKNEFSKISDELMFERNIQLMQGNMEWSFYDEICRGNIFYAPLNKIEITEQ